MKQKSKILVKKNLLETHSFRNPWEAIKAFHCHYYAI